MTEPPTAEGLEAIERFFFSRASDVFHEVSPLADPATLPLLTSRGYAPLELTTVLFRPVPHHAVPHPHGEGIDVRRIEPSERSLWAETAVRGWSDIPEAMEFLSSFGPIAAAAADAHPFLVWIDGAAVASGALAIHDGVALMAGASTVPLARGRGAQRALLAARLRYAAESGCTLAMVCAAPGTSSQRNAERSGFRIAYTRIKWVKRR
jgi:GNAT superfamily N-acetyltransferase